MQQLPWLQHLSQTELLLLLLIIELQLNSIIVVITLLDAWLLREVELLQELSGGLEG